MQANLKRLAFLQGVEGFSYGQKNGVLEYVQFSLDQKLMNRTG